MVLGSIDSVLAENCFEAQTDSETGTEFDRWARSSAVDELGAVAVGSRDLRLVG